MTTKRDSGWLSCSQPRLGTTGMIILLGAINAICPLSLDMFTPAVPSLPAYFSTSSEMVNLTIVGFYLFFSVSMLVFGPVSDRYGRKPVLVGSVVVFAVGSMLCAAAWSIGLLIVFRLVQAIGAGAACSVSMAIVKDCFQAKKRTQLLSILQILMVVAPVFAPLLGGFILQFFSWHATFIVLSVVGIACLPLACMFTESIRADERVSGGVIVSLSRMLEVAKDTKFTVFLVFMSLFCVPYMAYVQVASYVYVNIFGTTEQVYSYYFAVTAAFAVCGPLIYLKLSRWVSPRVFTHAVLLISIAVSAVLLVFGHASIWCFFAGFAVFVMAEATIRPYGTNILLSQQDADAGSASAIINFVINIFGVLGMGVVSFFSADYVQGLGVILLGSMIVAAVLWVVLMFSKRLHIPELDKRGE